MTEEIHAHSPANLRTAIRNILQQRAQERQHSDSCLAVVSHPPSPTSLHFPADSSNVRSLQQIIPLDLNSLQRIPLSTPPTTTTDPFSTTPAILNEQDYPLIVVTGGSGFIGSHTVLEILQQGKYGVVVIDNLGNSHLEVLHRVRTLASQYHATQGLDSSRHPPLYFHPCDIQDRTSLSDIFSTYANKTAPSKVLSSRIVAAIHFAALKSVSGSLADPLAYYQTNVSGTLNLIEILGQWNCKKLVFSSSCVVYGSGCDGTGISEEDCVVSDGGGKGITNPYGRTKRMCEEILGDVAAADPEWNTMSLRYTNPSGAHPSGWIGEDPTNAANLMPIVTHVLQGKRDQVNIYGADYNTPDGTGIRDFIHVVDLAKAHLAAIKAMFVGNLRTNNSTYNLGTNSGTSVLTVIETLSLIAQRPIKIVICPRRAGDLGCVVCSAAKAEKELGWKAEKGIVEMCRDLVNWQALNPEGYLTPDVVQ